MNEEKNEERTSKQRQDEQGNTRVRTRSRSLKGGLDPAELGRKSGQARRERRARAERDAELNKLTVRARLATGLAGELTAANLRAILVALVSEATTGSGHVRIQAAKLVLDLAQATVEDDGGEEPEGASWEELTPGQRAAAMAALDRHIMALAGIEETDGGRADLKKIG